jgi:hypothetical protein
MNYDVLVALRSQYATSKPGLNPTLSFRREILRYRVGDRALDVFGQYSSNVSKEPRLSDQHEALELMGGESIVDLFAHLSIEVLERAFLSGFL